MYALLVYKFSMYPVQNIILTNPANSVYWYSY